MVNVYDSANRLAEDLKKTPEYTALKEAVQSVKNDENSSNLFQKMDEVQTKIMAAQQSGQPLTDDVKNYYKELNDKVQKDANIIKLLTAEQGLYKLIDDLQKTFTSPINDLYSDLRK